MALLADPITGRLTETAVGHFLAVIDGELVGPERWSVLDGISLRVVDELCAGLGINRRDRPLAFADLRGASEAVLTGSAFGLAGVRSVTDLKTGVVIDLPWVGPVTERIQKAWSALVGLDIVGQFTSGR